MKPVKIVVMGLLAAAAWIADWILLKQNIYQNHDLSFIGWPSLATILGITFLTFFCITNRNRLVSVILDVIILAGYVIIMPKNVYVFIGGLIFFVFLVLFELRLLADGKSRLDFSVRRVMSGSISLTVYSLLLLIGLNIYYSTKTDFNANPEAYYSKLEQAAVRAANRTVPYLTDSLNTPLTDEQKQQISDTIAKETVDRIKQSTASYQQFFPFILAIIVTALLSSFSFLLRWAAIVVSWVIFRILLMTGFFKLEKEMVEVEKLNI